MHLHIGSRLISSIGHIKQILTEALPCRKTIALHCSSCACIRTARALALSHTYIVFDKYKVVTTEGTRSIDLQSLDVQHVYHCALRNIVLVDLHPP